MLYAVLVPLDRLLLRVFFRLRVDSPESVRSEGPLVVVANHDSLLDAFAVAAALPRRRLTFLAASYLFDMRIVGWFVRAIGALPVERGGKNVASLRKAIAVLRVGGTVVVFPEGGTLTSDILGGAAYLALKTGTPILPLHIMGTATALPPGALWPRFVRIEVRVGRPFCIASGPDTRRSIAEGRRQLERMLRG